MGKQVQGEVKNNSKNCLCSLLSMAQPKRLCGWEGAAFTYIRRKTEPI